MLTGSTFHFLPPLRMAWRENSATLTAALSPRPVNFKSFPCVPPSSILPRLVPAGGLCKLLALQNTSSTPPPAVNFLPVLHYSVYMLSEKLNQYRKYYIIPLALPVKSPSAWALWGWAIYYKCHITVAATFCVLWAILWSHKPKQKSTLFQPSQTLLSVIVID